LDDLGPFHNRPDEWELYNPLVGKTMLELGNKKNGKFIYKKFFESIGFEHTSVDINGEDGALKKDLTKPLNLGTFDMVTNIGTTEHVSEGDYRGQVACWKNIMEAMHVGSVLVSGTPAPGSWRHHGVWYPEPLFYEELARLNGLELERVFIDERLGIRLGYLDRDMVMARMVRVKDVPFVMPEKGMHRNVRVMGLDRVRRC